MLRSQTVLTIHDFHTQGKTVQEIAQELHLSRTTVRKYLKHPEAVLPKPRPPRSSKLDPYKEQIKKWITEDHCTNCEVLFERLQKLGYTGGISILKHYVHPLRPAVVLTTVYTRAGVELTDPQEGCKLKDIQIQSSGEQPCLGVRR